MKLIIVILTSLCLTGCGLFFPGTNTGNPHHNDGAMGPDIPGPGKGSAAYILAYDVCEKITTCYAGTTISACGAQIIEVNNYTSELGPTASAYTTLNELAGAELAGEVVPDAVMQSNCTLAIKALNCTDQLVIDAYTPATPSDYSATNILFQSSSDCAQVY